MNLKRYFTYFVLVAVIFVSTTTSTAFGADKTPKAENMITVAVTMEKFTLGQGYIIEPVLVTVPAGTQASVVITNLLKEKYPNTEQPYKMTGNIENSFYLASIYDPNQKDLKIPQYIMDVVGDKIDYTAVENDYLGEFNYYKMSGWMYAVGIPKVVGDSSFPNVGASAWRLEDGQVMRWQFTLYGYGADLNADNSEWGMKSIVNCGDKDDLIWKVAELNRAYDRNMLLELPKYNKAMTILTDPQAAQDKIDMAAKEIRNIKIPNETPFTDVANHWAKSNITILYEKDIIQGESATEFKPEDNITRAEFVQILLGMAKLQSRMSGSDITVNYVKVDDSQVAKTYSDVKTTDWYAKAIEWAHANGVLKGLKTVHSNKRFLPNKEITGQEMAVLMQNYSEQVEKVQKSNISSEMMGADGNYKIDPKGNVTRAQAAAIIANSFKLQN